MMEEKAINRDLDRFFRSRTHASSRKLFAHFIYSSYYYDIGGLLTDLQVGIIITFKFFFFSFFGHCIVSIEKVATTKDHKGRNDNGTDSGVRNCSARFSSLLNC